MKKLYRTLQFYLIFFFILVLAIQARAEVNLTKLVKKIQPAVVTVITYDINKKVLLQGTGFFVDKKGHLITNYHVLKGAFNAEVKAYDGKKYPIKLVAAENEAVDLIKVLVDIHEESAQCIRVTEVVPAVAERVIVVGSPMGLEQTVSEGIVSAIRKIPKVGEIFQISAPISSGSSGSPVINMEGEAIGVTSFYLMKGQNLNFAIPGRYVLDLKQGGNGKTIFEWTYGKLAKVKGYSLGPPLDYDPFEEENKLKNQKDQFYDDLAKEVPDWKRINKHPVFLKWVRQPGPYGIIRQELLDYHFDNFDVAKVAEFFKDFKNWKRRMDEWEELKRNASPAGVW